MVPTGYEQLKDYNLPPVLGREVDLTVATTRLIAGGIFDRFPNSKSPWRILAGHCRGKDRLVSKGYRFGTLKKPFAEYYDMVYFDMAGFEGGQVALSCALLGIRPERSVFASDYPQETSHLGRYSGRSVNILVRVICVCGSSIDRGSSHTLRKHGASCDGLALGLNKGSLTELY